MAQLGPIFRGLGGKKAGIHSCREVFVPRVGGGEWFGDSGHHCWVFVVCEMDGFGRAVFACKLKGRWAKFGPFWGAAWIYVIPIVLCGI